MSKRRARLRDSRKSAAAAVLDPPAGVRPRIAGFPAIASWGALFLAIFIAYWPALRGGMLWDDSSHVTGPDLQSLHGLWRIWFELGATQQYYPVLHSAFWLEHRLWGDAVLGYHLVNILLHGVSACLLVWIVRRLSLPGAWLAGFVFALHPVYVEGVAWISEQKSALSGAFFLAALLVYLGFDRSRSRRSYFLALGLFTLALLSKSVTATLPAVLLVIFWWRQGYLGWRRDVLPLVPWFALAVPMGLFTAWMERTYIGAVGPDFNLTFTQRLLIAGRDLWFYAAKLVLPVGLMFSYPRWSIDPAAWWQYLYPAGAVVVAGVCLLLARRHRGPLAGFLIFAGTLAPVLGFLNVLPFRYSWVADHFQYLASLGLVVPMAAYLTAAARRLSPEAGSRNTAIAAAAVAVLGILTFRQSASYRDEETLYRDTLKRNPASWLIHNNLATILEAKPGRMQEAIAEYQATLQLHPAYAAQTHFNLAGAYTMLDPPEHVPEAIAEYQEGLRLQPDNALAHINLGNILAGNPERTAEAASEFRQAIGIDPGLAQAHANLGTLLAQEPGRLPDAIGELETAVRLDPALAAVRCNLGNALSGMPGRLPDAIAQFEAALRIDPNFAEAHLLLGLALAEMPGRQPDAIAELRSALRLQPDSEPAKEALQKLTQGN
jgi:tetratricopeptide (TPR) repeat protein